MVDGATVAVAIVTRRLRATGSLHLESASLRDGPGP
jgi:hypothetical protein